MIHKKHFFWDKRINLIDQVRVFVDYSDPEANRSSAALEMVDIDQGSGDTITIETSDSGDYIWEEGVDFSLTDKERTTAEAIAEAINSTSDFTASAVTGYPGNSFVYIHYTASGHISDAYSGDTGAWEFYEVNASNGTIRTVYSTDSEAIKTQPFFSNREGFVGFYVADGSGKYDLDPWKSGVPMDETYFQEFTP